MEMKLANERDHFEVRAHWDAKAGVWWAESDDIPGLVTEAQSFDELVGNVCALIPDLLELNGVRPAL
jgi:predicted RNase H-like HicB family nuclease